MKNTYILALALGFVTTITASIPREDVTTETSPLIEVIETSENATDEETVVATTALEQTDVQELADNEETLQSDLQNEVEESLAIVTEEAYSAIEISIEEAQDLLGFDINRLAEGFEFEYEGRKYICRVKGFEFEHNYKKYIIRAVITPALQTENTFVEESQK